MTARPKEISDRLPSNAENAMSANAHSRNQQGKAQDHARRTVLRPGQPAGTATGD